MTYTLKSAPSSFKLQADWTGSMKNCNLKLSVLSAVEASTVSTLLTLEMIGIYRAYFIDLRNDRNSPCLLYSP
jgi:uncharacterized membrane protein YqhA